MVGLESELGMKQWCFFIITSWLLERYRRQKAFEVAELRNPFLKPVNETAERTGNSWQCIKNKVGWRRCSEVEHRDQRKRAACRCSSAKDMEGILNEEKE